MPQIRTSFLNNIQYLSKHERLSKDKRIRNNKKTNSKNKRLSLFPSKVPALHKQVDVGVFHKYFDYWLYKLRPVSY